ncbi:MAG: phosphomannomutase/phosphoglucomutase [Oleiphilaceae bacterium]|jgi:phosphomannomutase/phosphoglucomutase
MKFLKKKPALVKTVNNEAKSKAKMDPASLKTPQVGQSILSWVYQPVLAALALLAVAYLLLEFIFVQVIERQQKVEIKTLITSSMVQNFDAYMNRRKMALKALSSNIALNTLSSNDAAKKLMEGEDPEFLNRVLSAAFLDLDQIYVVSLADLTQVGTLNPSLSFAGIDLIRRAAAGEVTRAEAFLSDTNWLFQMAAPVKSESGDVSGAIMATFNLDEIKSLLALPNSFPQGNLSLVSNNGSRGKVVFSTGAGDVDQVVTIPTTVSQWSITYAPASWGEIDRTMMWIVFATVAVLLALIVFIVCRLKMNAVKHDLIHANAHFKKMLLGEGRNIKPFAFGEIRSMVTALSHNVKDLRAELESKAAKVKKEEKENKVDDADAPLFDDDLLDLDVLSENDLTHESLDAEESFDGDDMLNEVKGLDFDIPQSIFRAYDIRGIVDETLNEGIVELIGRAVATEALSQGQKVLCVGYDGRLSSDSYCEALTIGILSTGVDVINIGQVPTPVLYFATHHFKTDSGVMITGSHNPSNYNGLKIMIDGNTLSGDDIQKLYNRITLQDFALGQGQRSDQPIDREYIDTIVNDIAVAAPLRVVLDAGNGVAGGIAPALIEELGCEVIPLHCEVDGNFPNHHPDPGKPENLQDLIDAVKEHDADIGIAFDGDGDRIGVVTNEGKIIWPDRLLMLFAKDVVSRNPGADIIYDVKCSRRLNGLISSYGGRPVMWKTGHSLMKAKMKETGALLAGEMSGHMFFKERWFGFDDGLYSAARLLEILGVEDQSTDAVFASFPEDFSTPEINIPVTDETKFIIVEKLCLLKGMFSGGNVTTIDGLRVDFPNGWGLCRASNTMPVLVLRFEADDESALQEIKAKFIAQLKSIDPELALNF